MLYQHAIVPPLLVARGRPGGIVSRGVRLWRHFSDLGNAVWLRTESGSSHVYSVIGLA